MTPGRGAARLSMVLGVAAVGVSLTACDRPAAPAQTSTLQLITPGPAGPTYSTHPQRFTGSLSVEYSGPRRACAVLHADQASFVLRSADPDTPPLVSRAQPSVTTRGTRALAMLPDPTTTVVGVVSRRTDPACGGYRILTFDRIVRAPRT